MSRFRCNRTVVNNTKMAFFIERSDAIATANSYTRVHEQQWRAVYARRAPGEPIFGWLIRNAVTGEVHDVDGRLPKDSVESLVFGG